MNRPIPPHRATENPRRWAAALTSGVWLVLALTGASAALADRSRAPARGAAEPIAAAPVSPAASSTVSARCTECHTMTATLSHPVGVRPSMAVPRSLPLDSGLVTCTTCHEVIEHRGTGRGPMLRQGAGGRGAEAMVEGEGALCAQCHAPSARGGAAVHASGAGRAHLGSRPGLSRTAARMSGGLDVESMACLGCHDGAAGADIGMHGGTLSRRMGRASEHPIGVMYSSSTGRAGDVRLVEPGRLDPRIRLFGSAIGCGSCHSVYSTQDHLLVKNNQQSGLCLSCHVE